MSKVIYGGLVFKETTLGEDLTARILGWNSEGELVDRPAIDLSSFLTTSLLDGYLIVGSSGNIATAVDTASAGDIDADSVAGLTIKAGVIVDGDINVSAGIVYSKLNLSNSVVNADIASGAGIVYSKLSLSDSIVNADIAAGAAITRTKLATGTAYRILVNDSLGVISENAAINANAAVITDANGQLTHSATTADQIGYSSTLTGDIQSQLDNEVATKTVKAIVKAPTIAEHGYAITWDNTAGEWDLTDPVTQGIPLGGSTRQVLAKLDGTDWNADWTTLVLTDVSDVSSLAADLNLLAGMDAAGLTAVHIGHIIGLTGNVQAALNGKQSSTLATNAIWVGNSSNLAAALSAGTEGYVLKVSGGTPTWAPESAGSPPGVDTQVIFNDTGSLGTDTGFVYNKTTNTLTVVNLETSTTIGSAYVYRVGGTDVALADGGTGASLADPGADRIMFWDDSAGAVTWLTVGTGLSVSDTTITAEGSTNDTDTKYFEQYDWLNAGVLISSGWQSSNSGTGAGQGTDNYGEDATEQAMGTFYTSTGTTTTGASSVYKGTLRIGLGAEVRLRYRMALSALSDGTDTYTFLCGLSDSLNDTTPTNGIFFRYTHGTNAGEFEGVCSASGVESTIDTDVAAATTYKVLGMTISGDGTSVQFDIDGVNTGSAISTNIPTGVNLYMFFSMVKSAGTTARKCHIDYHDLLITRSTAR